jgi:hypothetical protein
LAKKTHSFKYFVLKILVMSSQKSSLPQGGKLVHAPHQQIQQQMQSPRTAASKKSTKAGGAGVEHQFLNKMPEVNSVENDLMKLLNEFSNTRLKKYGKFISLF